MQTMLYALAIDAHRSEIARRARADRQTAIPREDRRRARWFRRAH